MTTHTLTAAEISVLRDAIWNALDRDRLDRDCLTSDQRRTMQHLDYLLIDADNGRGTVSIETAEPPTLSCHCGAVQLASHDAEYDTSNDLGDQRHSLTDCYYRFWPYRSLTA